jgi:hypothetical protein
MSVRLRRWRYLLGRLAGLDARSLRALVEAQWRLLRAWWWVKTRPVGRLVEVGGTWAGEAVAARTVVERPGPSGAGAAGGEHAEAVALSIGIGRAARFGLFRPSCLVRSLALQSMLQARGQHGGVVRVGVRREGGGFVAHAWVELGGVALGEDPAVVRRYVPLSDVKLAALR